jgi:class 3 adenylate cyclase
MEFGRAANIIRQIGRALSAAHERGILHRDLKPENIMVQTLGDSEEQVKIIDFGIASVRNSVDSLDTSSGRTVGTVAYMSPEQLCAGHVSQPSDVYCFAVIAYELLTGRRPSQPEFAYQMLEMQRSGVRVKPSDLRAGLPKPVDQIILKGLSFESKDRYQRAREFGDILSSALTDDEGETPAEGDPKLEIAHVLFMDIVGYSKMPIEEQPVCLQKLQDIVAKTEDFVRAPGSKQLIRLSTGDGVALVFFDDPEAPLRCALAISQALKDCEDFGLRMGMHSGLVRRVADINTHVNVAGGGINFAQRVMDCGDAGHILVSKRVADDMSQLKRWASCLHDLGEVEVKHDVRVHVFNFFSDDFGNPAVPRRLRSRLPLLRWPAIAAAVTGLLIVGAIAFVYLRPHPAPVPVAPDVVVAPLPPEQTLNYSLTVQKMFDGRELGEELPMTGQEVFGNGWKFRFNIEPAQKGALYLLNEGPGAGGLPEYHALFPTPGSGGNAQISPNQRVQTGWNRFGVHTGIEKLWLIWSTQPIPELDSIFKTAADNEGVIADASKIGPYVERWKTQRPEIVADKSRDLTVVKGRGEIVVALVELNHKAY